MVSKAWTDRQRPLGGGLQVMSKKYSMIKIKIVKTLYILSNLFLKSVRKILWLRRRPHTAKVVCIYRIGNIGDIICALPAMHAIRQAYPLSRLILLTSPGKRDMPGAKELLSNASWLDKIIVYYSDEINTIKKQMAFIKKLRKESIDICFELPNDLATLRTSLRNMLAVRMWGVSWGYGWRISTIRWNARLQSEKICFPDEVDRLLKVVAEAGIDTKECCFPLSVNDSYRQTVKKLIAYFNDSQVLIIAIAPGAKRPTNWWPLERYAAVAAHLKLQGANIILVGGTGDKPACDKVNELSGNACLNLAGETSLLESCALLEKCRLLIANDSGVQHLAAAVGTPCISLFSCLQFRGKWIPHGKIHTIIRKWPDCHTCFLKTCPKDNLCMRMISTEEVIEIIDEKLKTI